MTCKTLFGHPLLAILGVFAIGVSSAMAQCCGGGAVGVTPTYTTAYASTPVVYQTAQPTTGWYPGAMLDRWRINRWNRWNNATTVTAGYAPTYAAAYTAAYTPTYPPSYYATSYRAAYPMSYSVGYAPTVVAAPCCSQQVVMRPVCDTCVSPCSGCDTGCASCGGSSYVGQAVYESSGSTGCAGCSGGGSTYSSTPINQSPTPAPTNGATPQPGLSPDANIPETRVERQESTNGDERTLLDQNENQPTPVEESEENPPSTMFQPPQLFNPGDSVTNRSNAPVWTAVYHATAKPVRHTAKPIASPAKAKPTAEQEAEAAKGWTSAGR